MAVKLRTTVFQNGDTVQSVDFDTHPNAWECLLDRGFTKEGEQVVKEGLQENFVSIRSPEWTASIVWVVE